MYYFIVNPGSRTGEGRKIWQETEAILTEKRISYEVHFTDHKYHASELTRTLCAKGEPFTLVVLGGDGTLNEVLQGITEPSLVTLGYIPTGSGNDFAKGCQMPLDVRHAVQNILSHKYVKQLDIGQIQDLSCKNARQFSAPMHTARKSSRSFLVSAGIGFDAAVCAEALDAPIKRFLNRIHLGKFTYVGIALHQIFSSAPFKAKVVFDGEPHKTCRFSKTLFISVMNLPSEGGGLKLTPVADGSDGFLDVCIVNGLPTALLLLLLPTAFFGKHVYFRRFVTIHRCQSVRIYADRPLPVHTDGESFGTCKTVRMAASGAQIAVICGGSKQF